MTIKPFGFVPGQDSLIKLQQDPTNSNAYDDLSQVWYQVTPVPAETMRFVNELLDSTAPDVDMYVGFDENGNGKPDLSEEVCAATTVSWDEKCSIDMPKKGNWWVLVQNWTSSAVGIFDSIRLATAVVPGEDSGNMTFDAPQSVPALEPFDINIKYDLTNGYAGQAWYGSFSIGTDAGHPGNMGNINVDLYRYEDDVVKSAAKRSAMPGDIVKFTIKVNNNVLNEDVDYKIIDMIPDGLTYVAGSAAASMGIVVVDGSELTWTGTLPNPESAEFDSNVLLTGETITYEVTVDDDVKLGDVLMNRVKSTTSNINSKEVTTSAGVHVGHQTFHPIVQVMEPE